MVTGTLKHHFDPGDGSNIDVITLEVDGSDVHYFLPKSLAMQHWPFGRAAQHPQVRVETHPTQRQAAGSVGNIEVITSSIKSKPQIRHLR